jgi:hypothetical protein
LNDQVIEKRHFWRAILFDHHLQRLQKHSGIRVRFGESIERKSSKIVVFPLKDDTELSHKTKDTDHLGFRQLSQHEIGPKGCAVQSKKKVAAS